MDGGRAARRHQLWGQTGIILLSGTQKAALSMVPTIACVFILSAIIEYLLCAGLEWRRLGLCLRETQSNGDRSQELSGGEGATWRLWGS